MTTCGYELQRISGPDLEPITLEEAKNACKVDLDITEDDAYIELLIEAAREIAEDYVKGTFVETLWELSFAEFPPSMWTPTGVELPMGPVIDVVEMSYVDTDGARQVMDVTALQVVRYSAPPSVLPAFGQYWPNNVQGSVGSIRIRYLAGYRSQGSPAGADKVPKKVKQALRMMVAHWYENREAVATETRQIPTVMPFGFERLLDPLRRYP